MNIYFQLRLYLNDGTGLQQAADTNEELKEFLQLALENVDNIDDIEIYSVEEDESQVELEVLDGGNVADYPTNLREKFARTKRILSYCRRTDEECKVLKLSA